MTPALWRQVEEAVRLHQQGCLDEAEALYRAVLASDPRCADALHFLGMLEHQRGDAAAAEQLMRAALEIDPSYADAHNNLGNVLKRQKRLEEARSEYETALALRPGDANALNNLGTVFHALGRFGEAWNMYAQAIASDPGQADAYVNCGNLLKKQGRINEAIDAYLHALSLRRFPSDAYRNLGFSLYAVGRIQEALDVFSRWQAVEPEDAIARHMVAACSGVNVPPRASDDFVRETFARFADCFDAVLGELDYRAPELVAASVAASGCPPAGELDVLDAGCGTGLCGPLLRPYARHLVGVDLSAHMIEKAAVRGVYDELVVAELTAYLQSRPASIDLIGSADTLVYFGSLRDVLHAAASALRPTGRVVFTVEHARDSAGEGFQINPHGRYSHSERYVRDTLGEAGLTVEEVTTPTLRKEKGEPVAGLVVRARR